MLINLRNALMAGKKRVTFIEWLASDGTGYVDLQYAPIDPETRMLITASTSTAASRYAPLVCSGMNTAINDVSKPSFGFASLSDDRQMYLKSARQHWWNMTANSGNWNDGNFHSIDIGQSGATSSTCSVDGLSISMQRITNSTAGSMPTDTQTVFASKYNGKYYLKNSKFKVARIAYEVGGVIVHDFVAAKVGETCGFYDITTSKFIAGTGAFTYGNDLKYPIPSERKDTP